MHFANASGTTFQMGNADDGVIKTMAILRFKLTPSCVI
jgi:hypothetical protein